VDGVSYRYGFQGQEKDDEVKGTGNSYDFGARIYDSRIGRWLSSDPLESKYPSLSSYNFVANTPLMAIDPDGKRIIFIGGAGNDKDGWNYINRFIKIFKKNGMSVKRLNASYGKGGDVYFTSKYRNSAWTTDADAKDLTSPNRQVVYRRIASTQKVVNKAVHKIMKDLVDNPLKEGETLDLMGYSYGSVAQAHIALALADRGVKVDNLILVASPISDDSPLFRALSTNKNIGAVIRKDIEGDLLSNPDYGEFQAGGVQSLSDDAPHFDLARPGAEADTKIDGLAKDLKSKGVGKPGKASASQGAKKAGKSSGVPKF